MEVTRPRPSDSGFMAFIARLPRKPREGRIQRQVRRALLVAHGQPITLHELRTKWCYHAQPFQRWQCWSIKRALLKLGAKQIGRSPTGIGRPGIWAYTENPPK